MKCLYCQKEFEAKRSTARFDTDVCRVAYSRVGVSVTKDVPVSVTKTEDSVTKEVSVTVSVTEKKELKFTDEPIEERVKSYRDLYPDSTFVPNWVAHGFASKEEAIRNALMEVQKNKGIVSMGLGND